MITLKQEKQLKKGAATGHAAHHAHIVHPAEMG
jgi:hypothetical protein